jgi:hypothetical protein
LPLAQSDWMFEGSRRAVNHFQMLVTVVTSNRGDREVRLDAVPEHNDVPTSIIPDLRHYTDAWRLISDIGLLISDISDSSVLRESIC